MHHSTGWSQVRLGSGLGSGLEVRVRIRFRVRVGSGLEVRAVFWISFRISKS